MHEAFIFLAPGRNRREDRAFDERQRIPIFRRDVMVMRIRHSPERGAILVPLTRGEGLRRGEGRVLEYVQQHSGNAGRYDPGCGSAACRRDVSHDLTLHLKSGNGCLIRLRFGVMLVVSIRLGKHDARVTNRDNRLRKEEYILHVVK